MNISPQFWLLFSLITPLLGWLFQLTSSFLLVTYGCTLNVSVWFSFAAFISLAMGASGLAAGRWSFSVYKDEKKESFVFMAKLSLMLALLLVLTTVAQISVIFFMELC